MAKKAVEMTSMALRAYGPTILRSKYYDTAAKKYLDRLQAAPDERHSGVEDPHRTGRALDIILLSTVDYEKLFADQLVELFLDMREDMQWSAVIYNRREWNAKGAVRDRVWKKGIKEDPYSFEHISHIHIEWPKSKADRGDFWIFLTEAARQKFA